MTEEYVGSDLLEPTGYLQPRPVKITCRCLRCGDIYSWVAKAVTSKDRPCPKKACKQAALEAEIERRAWNLAKMLEERRAPAHIGENNIVKAIDTTAQIVMEDHHLTDLKDNIREGETMVPKLPGHLQHQADTAFTGQAVMESAGIQNRQAQAMGRRALAGAFRGMAVNPTSALGQRTKGEPALRSIRTENLQ